MRTIELGAITVHRATELERWAFAPRDLFPDITPEQVADAGRRFGDNCVEPGTGRLILSIHSYVVRAPGLTLLVDPGNGNDKERPALLAHHRFHTDHLDRLGVDPGEVDIVVSTHLHPDHCGWNARLADGQWSPTFPRARYLFDRTEFETLAKLWESAPADPVAADLARMFEDSVLPVTRSGQAELVEPPYVVYQRGQERVTLRQAPGHTDGHLVVEVTSGDRSAVIVGDVVHHPLQFVHPELAQLGDQDPERARSLRGRLWSEFADRDVIVLPAHFPEPTAGRIVSGPDGFRYAWLNGATG
ncbi:MBL fold metallo-hydrolase [Acrocarpospora catenulata]|uniref:MBL fold metallo-hydrolase n=1 Tax=Acrocarpospora catenulata TaxID=2836182 RepID=UPI001BDAF620|nr:MBL fold metallo-hydrolase [Acrocarpospora catenulata]